MAQTKYELIEFNPINNIEIQAALEQILASSMFVNTTRMSRLLSFLVNKALTGTERDISEYVIGIEVFDKNPATYNTYEDSVVRVQTKRLRLKLNAYYASLAVAPDIQITIPTGGYLPVFSRKVVVDDCLGLGFGCAFCHPAQLLKCISHSEQNLIFMQGLNEELIHQLFKAFGRQFFLTLNSETESFEVTQIFRCGAKHLLTGSVIIDAERLRVCIRLLDVLDGQIVWSEQFDRSVFFSIGHQEELALAICAELKRFFGHEQQSY